MLIVELIALLSCSLFAGAAIYINVAEHPARLECGTELAANVFGPSYRRASVMQASLALVATVTGLTTGLNTGADLWYLGSALIFAVIPFTFIVIMPTNKLLLDPERRRTLVETHKLLRKWGHLHWVRSGFSLLATVLFLYSAVSV
ncbi:DUF1772 domain-containing protein [Idiomarina sp. HP20-50]|uniref:DUF1772 domain-containing protein n=1 Tax=Idiomarina sp. HP20-50 TaxID=3070813 RepID=UPI00294B90EB|nr:DUF1772 domain-containing protein [Idiomarina sp. HP20-50]MDV6317269.1 DUF1772 domain-containing protein [Idiomarina sp. HP20-50]